jgi:hypothetical protein
MGDRGSGRPGGVRRLVRRAVRERLRDTVDRCVDVRVRGTPCEPDREPDGSESVRVGH